MIHSFLLIGQSNAAGRGFLEEAEPLDTCNKRLKVMRNGLWLKMFRPVNPDNLHFSAAALKEFGVRYYQAYEALAPLEKTEGEPVASDTERTAMELL